VNVARLFVLLREIASSPVDPVAALGAQILAELGDDEAAPILRRLLDRRDPDTVRAAAAALGRLGDRGAVPRLLELAAAEPRTWLAVIDALGAIGDAAALPHLAEQLDDRATVIPVARALGRIGDPRAVAPLLRILVGDGPSSSRLAAVVGLAELLERNGDAAARELAGLRGAIERSADLAPLLADLLAYPDREIARAAARLVLAAGLRRWLAHVLLHASRRDDDRWLRDECERWSARIRRGLIELCETRDRDVVRMLLLCMPASGAASARALRTLALAWIEGDDPRVRAAACVTLGRLGSGDDGAALVDRLRRGDPLERLAASEALARLPAAALAPLGMEALFDDGRPAVRAAALRAIGPGADDRLLLAVHDPEPEVVQVAVELLAERGAASAVPHLLRLVSAAGPVRSAVLRALEVLGDEATAEELANLVERLPAGERVEVIRSVGRIPGAASERRLRAWLAGDEPPLRRAAADALARLSVGTAGLPTIAALARDLDPVVRYQAAWALGRSAAASRPLLEQLAADPDVAVANEARAGLIGRGP
jgi:HEAT repeat protein